MATDDVLLTSPNQQRDKDHRITVEVGRGVEWLCEAEMVGWRTTASGFGGPVDVQVLPP